MSKGNAEILMVGVIIARATSYIFAKVSMDTMEPFNLLGIRFILAFIVLVIIFDKKLKNISLNELKYGVLLGLVLYIIMSFELFGLKTTDSSMVSFIENTAIVYVPVINAVLVKRFPKFNVIMGTAVTIFGIALLTMEGTKLSFTLGEALCFGAAIFYAVMIVLTDRVACKGDPITLGIIQIGVVGILGIGSSLLIETPHLPVGGAEWIYLFALVLICTVFGFTFQPLAQKYMSVERAGQIAAINPVAAAVIGWMVLDERMDMMKITGAILIIGGVLFSERKKRPKKQMELQRVA